MSKILVIRHTVLDVINYNDNSDTRPGGNYHTINTLVNIKNNNDLIYLTTIIPQQSYALYKSIYDKVNLDFSIQAKNIPTVTLRLFDNEERHECHHEAAAKIELSPEIHFQELEGILINMISGYDIDIEDITFIREKSDCKLYLDIHSMARDIMLMEIENLKR